MTLLNLLAQRVSDNQHAGVFLVGSTEKMRQSLMDLAAEIAAPEGDAGDRLVPLRAPYVQDVYHSNVLNPTDAATVHTTISVVRIDTAEEAVSDLPHLKNSRKNDRIVIAVVPSELLEGPLNVLVENGAFAVLRIG